LRDDARIRPRALCDNMQQRYVADRLLNLLAVLDRQARAFLGGSHGIQPDCPGRGGHLAISAAAWKEFTTHIKQGTYDL
jgi:hypothetical protein